MKAKSYYELDYWNCQRKDCTLADGTFNVNFNVVTVSNYLCHIKSNSTTADCIFKTYAAFKNFVKIFLCNAYTCISNAYKNFVALLNGT